MSPRSFRIQLRTSVADGGGTPCLTAQRCARSTRHPNRAPGLCPAGHPHFCRQVAVMLSPLPRTPRRPRRPSVLHWTTTGRAGNGLQPAAHGEDRTGLEEPSHSYPQSLVVLRATVADRQSPCCPTFYKVAHVGQSVSRRPAAPAAERVHYRPPNHSHVGWTRGRRVVMEHPFVLTTRDQACQNIARLPGGE